MVDGSLDVSRSAAACTEASAARASSCFFFSAGHAATRACASFTRFAKAASDSFGKRSEGPRKRGLPHMSTGTEGATRAEGDAGAEGVEGEDVFAGSFFPGEAFTANVAGTARALSGAGAGAGAGADAGVAAVSAFLDSGLSSPFFSSSRLKT